MKTLMKVLGVIGLLIVAFVIGRSSASESASADFGESIEFVQAEKVWHSLVAFREVQAYFEVGCSPSAKKKVANEIDISLMFIAEHVRAHPHGTLATMFATREPGLLEEVRGKTIDWNRTFTVPKCVPPERVERGAKITPPPPPPPPDAGDFGTFHSCKAKPRRELSVREKCQIEELSARCTPADDCLVSCISSTQGQQVGGGCSHVCFFGLHRGESKPPGWAECDTLADDKTAGN